MLICLQSESHWYDGSLENAPVTVALFVAEIEHISDTANLKLDNLSARIGRHTESHLAYVEWCGHD